LLFADAGGELNAMVVAAASFEVFLDGRWQNPGQPELPFGV
jgi:hypothetical protein